MGKAYIIGGLFQVHGSIVHPRREFDEFAKLVAISEESPKRAIQTPVVVNNSGSIVTSKTSASRWTCAVVRVCHNSNLSPNHKNSTDFRHD
jgi:hypothetical protein